MRPITRETLPIPGVPPHARGSPVWNGARRAARSSSARRRRGGTGTRHGPTAARRALVWRPVRAIRRFSVRTVLPAPIAALGDLASNLRWSWHAPTRDLFAEIDPARWQAVRHDPVALLGDLGPERLEALAADPAFVATDPLYCLLHPVTVYLFDSYDNLRKVY